MVKVRWISELTWRGLPVLADRANVGPIALRYWILALAEVQKHTKREACHGLCVPRAPILLLIQLVIRRTVFKLKAVYNLGTELAGICRSSLTSTVKNSLSPSKSILGECTKIYRVFTEKVLVLTADGRTLTGKLLSCDQLTNLVLQNTIERVIRPHDDPEDSEEVPHGLYLIRGENVAICGLLDEQMDGDIDWAKVKGSVIGGVKHTWGLLESVMIDTCY